MPERGREGEVCSGVAGPEDRQEDADAVLWTASLLSIDERLSLLRLLVICAPASHTVIGMTRLDPTPRLLLIFHHVCVQTKTHAKWIDALK